MPPPPPPAGPRPDGGTHNLRPRAALAADAVTVDAAAITAIVFGRATTHPNTTAAAEYAAEHPGSHDLYVIDNAAAVLATFDVRTPSGHAQAMKLDEANWTAAERKELASHKRNGSWELADRTDRTCIPADANIVNFLWVYKHKRDGTYKARLCIDGSGQRHGVDYDQTFAATLRTTTLRCFAGIQASLHLHSARIDLVTAYLQGELLDGEVLYSRMPPGHEVKGADGYPRVCIIKKPIYGMKQAGRRLQRKLFPWLRQWRDGALTQVYTDSCVFIARDGDDLLLIGIFVDDLSILYKHTGPSSLYAAFHRDFHAAWDAEDEGELSDLLNIHWRTGRDTVTLHQRPYIDSLTARYFPDGVPTSLAANQTPHSPDIKERVLSAVTSGATSLDAASHGRYRSIVGALIYCAVSTRPDISYAVGMLSRAMHCPTPELLDEAERVLTYLHLHRDVGLTYGTDARDLMAYTDSDFASNTRSTSGWLIMWHTAAITWGSKQQATVALSSCEAEIIAASRAAQEVVYTRRLITEMGFEPTGTTALGCDNKGAKDTAYNPENHERMKHVDRRDLYVRECIEHGHIHVPYVKSADNLADFFTKPLKPRDFFRLRDIIMNVSAH